MQGLPEGWVTDEALGLSRVQQLKMLGNGVVTQQALLALALAGGATRELLLNEMRNRHADCQV